MSMTIEEIKNTPELVDYLLDDSLIANSRKKIHKRLNEICNLAIKALEQETCEDCISRQEAIDMIENAQIITDGEFCGYCTEDIDINILPPVTPQPKTGHWIALGNYDDYGEECTYKCLECGDINTYHDNYCSECGTKMSEPLELQRK